MAEYLSELASIVGGRVLGDGRTLITDVIHDHRDGYAGALFVARRGLTTDGHRFVPEAATTCAAVCVDHETPGLGVPQLIVHDTRPALGSLAAAVHGYPFEALRAVGVTGTNGKTMVTNLVGSIVKEAGGLPAVAGTLGWRAGKEQHDLVRTSPEASDLQRIAARMLEGGADIAAFEVSSHALAMGRVAGAHFAVAGFTNLSRDHLDFHEDMEGYYAAKASLFSPDKSERGVVWVDDPAGARLAKETDIDVTTVGSTGDVTVGDIETSVDGSRFSLGAEEGSRRVWLPLPGVFNVSNAAVAAACALLLDVDIDAVVGGLESAAPVSGRFERIAGNHPFTVIVDYAHTPDGVASAIAAGRRISTGRVLVVVGAGGDRDVDKRPLMGSAASEADVVVVTSDNPRSEDPGEIAEQVARGVTTPSIVIELDRRAAIRAALDLAAPGDIVLVLGKGHERGQEFADHVEPFLDASVVSEELAALA